MGKKRNSNTTSGANLGFEERLWAATDKPKTLCINPRRAIDQIVESTNDPGNRYSRTQVAFAERMGGVTNPRQRIIDHGEVFTPPELVNHMLDLVSHECDRVDSRFLEPACGDGNFLAEVLRRKLLSVDKKHARNREKWEWDAILSVCSLYGIDLLPDNITACRDRLLKVVSDAHAARFNSPLPEPAARAATYILSQNIVQGDALHMRTAEDSPIIFPEWSPLARARLKRRDYAYDELADQSDFALLSEENDLGHKVFPPPRPVADYPTCHYLEVAEQAEDRR